MSKIKNPTAVLGGRVRAPKRRGRIFTYDIGCVLSDTRSQSVETTHACKLLRLTRSNRPSRPEAVNSERVNFRIRVSSGTQVRSFFRKPKRIGGPLYQSNIRMRTMVGCIGQEAAH
jgi:hypothetical protein